MPGLQRITSLRFVLRCARETACAEEKRHARSQNRRGLRANHPEHRGARGRFCFTSGSC
jgi:hypothetical protein